MASGDIKLSSNFELNSERPLDAKVKVASMAERDAMPSIQRYDLMIVSVHGDRTYQLKVGLVDNDKNNNANWKIFGEGGVNSLISVKEKFIVDTTIINNGYVDIQNVPNLINEHFWVIFNGYVLDEGINDDFELLVKRLNIFQEMNIDDKIIVKYKR